MSPRLWLWISAGHRLRMARAALGVALVVGLATAALSLIDGLGRALQQELASVGGELRVRAPSLSIGGIDLSGGVVPGRALDDAALAALAALDGVADVQPEAWARVPLVFTGSFAGQRLQSEGAMLGVLAAAVDNPRRWDWSPGEPVPVLAPRSLQAVYNGSFAPTNGLPRLNDSALTGLDFTILAGRSLYGRASGQRLELKARVVGTTRYGGALAAIVPLAVVRWVEEQQGLDEPGMPSAARLLLRPDAHPDAVEQAARGLGWAVERGDGALDKLAALLESVKLGIGATVAVLVLATLLSVGQLQATLIRARAEEVRVLRALGLSGWRVGAGLLLEVLLGVALASVPGGLTGWLLSLGVADRTSNIVSEWIGMGVRIQPGLPLAVWAAALLGPAPGAALMALPAVLGVTRRT